MGGPLPVEEEVCSLFRVRALKRMATQMRRREELHFRGLLKGAEWGRLTLERAKGLAFLADLKQ
jgi:hypothetical protein